MFKFAMVRGEPTCFKIIGLNRLLNESLSLFLGCPCDGERWMMPSNRYLWTVFIVTSRALLSVSLLLVGFLRDDGTVFSVYIYISTIPATRSLFYLLAFILLAVMMGCEAVHIASY